MTSKLFHKTEKSITLSKSGDIKELKNAGPLIRQRNIKNRANVCTEKI